MKRIILIFITSVLLASCGGDGTSSNNENPNIPDSTNPNNPPDNPNTSSPQTSPIPKSDKYQTYGLQLLDELNTKFYNPNNKLYVNSINSTTLEKGKISGVWSTTYMINALLWGAMLDAKYDERLSSLISQLDFYVNGEGFATTHNGQRFFDDNGFLSHSLMNVYQMRLPQQDILDKSLFAINYVLKYRDANWGLPQTEPNLGKGIFYVGPILPLSIAAAKHYKQTKDNNDLYIAKTYYDKLNDYNIKLKDMNTNLIHSTSIYENGIWNAQGGYRASASANTASLGLQLYKISGDIQYLNQAKQMTDLILNRWYKQSEGFAEASMWGSVGTIDLLCELYEIEHDYKWYAAARDIIDFLIDKTRDNKGYYPSGTDKEGGYWNIDRTNSNPPSEITLISQAAAAAAILRFAYLELHKD